MKSNSAPLHLFRREAARVNWRAWCVGLAALALLPLPASAQTITSAVPGFITYQGKVSNASGTLVGAGTPVNRNVIFRIWSHQSNGTVNDLVYSEQQTVTISEGEFSVLIGQGSALSTTPLGYNESAKGPPTTTVASAAVFGGATRFLGVTIDDPATAADPEISPRQQLVTSAYAFRAKYAETVGANGANSLTALDNGNVGIGTGNPGARLEVNGSIRAGGVGTPTANLSLLANSATTQAMSIGYSNSIGTYSSDAAAGDTVIRTENGGKLLLQTGTGASALTIAANNRVGIFATNPSSMLQVGSGANLGHAGLLINYGWFNSADTTEARPFEVRFRNETGPRVVINTDGNLGIGTGSPSAKLHVAGVVKVDGVNFIELGAGVTKELNAGKIGYATFTAETLDIVGAGTTAANRKIKLWNEGGAIFTGGVGIGGVLGGGMLTVHGTHTDVVGNHSSFVAHSGTGGTHAGTFTLGDVSIKGQAAIHAAHFRAVSDARIKRIQGRSDGATDLALLNQIEITDYTYIDAVSHGVRPNKKLIGQQVESVFPQAVTRTTDVAADIYKPAAAKDGWIELATYLKAGERVRLIADKDGGIYDVLEVLPDRFRTNYTETTDKLIVYGREVKDFRVVDYEAIAMLNVSATQELKRQNDALVARVAELEAKDRARDTKLAAIEKLLQSSQTVLARPAATNANGQD